MRLIGLITDFGYEDEYVGVMKGVVYSNLGSVKIVDILHNIEPFNIRGSALILKSTVKYFPEDTVFVVVIDPGVGTERKGVILFKNKQIFIGPDNGVFSLLFEDEENTENTVFEIDSSKLDSSNISSTFHGRDVFIKAAIEYIKGKDVRGNPLKDPVKLGFSIDKGSYVEGHIVHFDRFGNALTDIKGEGYGGSIEFRDLHINIFKTFGDVEKEELLAFIGSRGFYEIGIREFNFKEKFRVNYGEKVIYRRE